MKWLDNNYGDLRGKFNREDMTFVYSKEGQTYFIVQPRNSGRLWVSRSVWEIFQALFGYSREEMTEIFKAWVLDKYKIKIGWVTLHITTFDYDG